MCFDITKSIKDLFTKEKSAHHDSALQVTRAFRVLAFFWVMFATSAQLHYKYNRNYNASPTFLASSAYLNAVGVF